MPCATITPGILLDYFADWGATQLRPSAEP